MICTLLSTFMVKHPYNLICWWYVERMITRWLQQWHLTLLVLKPKYSVNRMWCWPSKTIQAHWNGLYVGINQRLLRNSIWMALGPLWMNSYWPIGDPWWVQWTCWYVVNSQTQAILHYSDIIWVSWHLNSPANQLFVQWHVQANRKVNWKLITGQFVRRI